MSPQLCPSAAAFFDLTDPCVRAALAALLPASFLALLALSVLLHPLLIHLQPYSPLTEFLTLAEAEALAAAPAASTDAVPEAKQAPRPLTTFSLASSCLVPALAWIAYAFLSHQGPILSVRFLYAPALAICWLAALALVFSRHGPTVPRPLFALAVLLLVGATVQLGGTVYDYYVNDDPWPPASVLAIFQTNLAAALLLLAILLRMPLAVPSALVDADQIGASISPEDYTSLFGWITFSWVYPLIRNGRYNTLGEQDVWNMSPTMQSRPVFAKFSALRHSKLLRTIWAANSLDMILDFALTLVSVFLNYSTPFFLKRILDAIDTPKASRTPEDTARAYIYAFLAFICTLLRTEADVQHLWFGRRAATRVRSQLMAAIYDKALKRKDFSGIVDKDKTTGANDATRSPKAEKGKKDKAKQKGDQNDPKAGADVGKIVNLMAGDTNKISQAISGIYFLYGAPFEIVIASVFLYQLLGLSAFAGFIVLVIGWPLNTFVTRRSIQIQKGLLSARDKRMGILNELIGAIKFIKFFAWEPHWISRTLDARKVEIDWMVKARVNSVMFYVIWTCLPVFVSVISFYVYVVWAGGELSVSVAFTAIALFNMIRAPLNVIPSWIMFLLQAGVAIKRIEVFLEEDEVSDQVSSIKGVWSPLAEDATGFGIVDGAFKWNAVEEVEKKDKGNGVASGHKQNGTGHSRQTTMIADEDEEAAAAVFLDDDHKFELRDIQIMFPEGELTVITGPTASGKTALLMALLGEMTLLSGRVVLSKDPHTVDEYGHTRTISYAAQTPWLRHQSIKDNILFGNVFEEERYRETLECCALNPDLAVLEDGDATEIGARGVSLSGGQKARVALARAVYARTQYVLLDDPLSAVDSHTARFLYERLLCGPLLAHRTVILVTHHVDLVLPGAYYLVRMLDGRIDTKGTIKDLRARGLLEAISHEAEAEVQIEVVAPEAGDVDEEEEEGDGGATSGERGEAKPHVRGKKPRKLIKDEHRETGGVKWNIYNSYLKASSYWIWLFLFMLVMLSQLLGLTEKVWIMIWGEAYAKSDPTAYMLRSFPSPPPVHDHQIHLHEAFTASPQHHTDLSLGALLTRVRGRLGIDWPDAAQYPLFYVKVYAAIGMATALTSVMSVTAQYTAALRASRILFKKLLITVVSATFRFHDTTPTGRMLNRFGKDIETIDGSLVGSLQSVNSTLANFFASIITVVVVFPAFVVPAVVIGFGYYQLAVGYLNTGRDLRRMEANSRSPIYSDFGELLEGIVTVRAFSVERRFLDNLHAKVDVTTKMWYSFWMTNRWLLLNFDALGALAVFITMLFAIATMDNGAGLAGLSITSAMSFTMAVYWACRSWTVLELDLNSVERIVEYLDLPQEPPATIETNRPPAYWPSSARNESLIAVEDLVVKYAPDLPAVLHNVSFTLRAGERVGLLGRTGSGKSTLAMSMLRFVDPTSGHIFIDGIDISTIGVHDLRSRLTFIPQDATLFSGTIRDNLDPFGEHTDAECLDVLRRVQMITDSPSGSGSSSRPRSISSVEQDDGRSVSTTTIDGDAKTTVSLETKVSAAGTNFSQGQRQLIAMARALLRRSSIIVLDEATSSIDFATDAKIQTTIREEFTNSLLLTVAHRLRTVIDYDRLIVLDKGQIVEFDTPWSLIRKDNGVFRQMCLKSGSFGELEAAARAKAERDGEAQGQS